ncbi:hypothetical protein K493DRAFT_315206 [Basidiobolus meristosporus CBS 931.73]|uniref:Uncharacterized protein n=1 Tax=Basidiobolus meristosporus CBS 931.73 TaxID=1314790 RepID=A0A1Y1YBT4_9FUNG|nr:hypothetical protein K493DRAFT_315206 [Basidiobolus meristosporus CBS 931.73]|eukprot:ORX95064.1 hypothetical protein K493DRAFT_315206 [Basidiobolus meristosporus CBS 931.73]
MPSLGPFNRQSDPGRKTKSRRSHPLTQENLQTHNTLMPPAKESKRARVTQYVNQQTDLNLNLRERSLHEANSGHFRSPSIHTLEDVPDPDAPVNKDLDDSVSMMGRRRRKARFRLWFHRIVCTLKQMVPRMGKPHSYQSQQLV